MRFAKPVSVAAIALLTALAGLSSLHAQQQKQGTHKARYTIKDLGTLGGTFAFAGGISDDGWVVGFSTLPGDNVTHSFLWRNGVVTDLGTLGGPNSFSDFRPNEFGDAGGYSDLSTSDPNGEDFCGFGTQLVCLAFFWHQGAMHALPTLGGNNGGGFGTNNLGDLAGDAENTVQEPTCAGTGQVFQYKPVIWRQGRVHELPTLGNDPVGVAYAINDLSEAVGQTGPCGTEAFGGTGHAVLWKNGKAIDLGSLGGTTNNAPQDLNIWGQVVGFSGLSGDATFHAFLWQRSKMADLGTLPGDVHSVAESINIWGEVVGRSSDADFNGRGWVLQNGVMTDLNTLIPANSPLYIEEGTANNDWGQIAGIATEVSTGETHAVLLIPVGNGSASAAISEALDTVRRPAFTLSANQRRMMGRRGKRFGSH
jgi:probable HAF family extracellular repeat protein